MIKNIVGMHLLSKIPRADGNRVPHEGPGDLLV